MGKECGVTTPLGPAQPKALWLGNNKRGTLEESKGAHIRALTAPPTYTHIHTHRDPHKHTHALTPPPLLPVPTYWSRLLLLAACHPRKKRALSLLPLSSLPPSLSLSLSSSYCERAAREMLMTCHLSERGPWKK